VRQHQPADPTAADVCGLRHSGVMVIREAKPEDWPAIWLILKEEGTGGETLTWDPTRTEARARAGWMREPPGRTIVAVDDDGSVIGSADTHPIHPARGRTLPMPGLSSTRHAAVRAWAVLCAAMSWTRLGRTAIERCSSTPLSKPTRRRSGCGARSAFGSLLRFRRRFVTRHADTLASTSCTGRFETGRSTLFRQIRITGITRMSASAHRQMDAFVWQAVRMVASVSTASR
jgi:hypothetical protein